MKKTLKFVMAACMAWSIQAVPAAAQYPEKPVTLIIPFGAGGTSDVVARLVSKALSDELKQQVVAELRGRLEGNMSGA